MAASGYTTRPNEPDPDCSLCQRLHRFALENRDRFPGWHNAPVETWYPPEGPAAVELLIVGLAPGLRGANRTGVPFMGDDSGALLHETLARHGLTEDGARHLAQDRPRLKGVAITNAVRCVPPGNKPFAAEVNTCRQFLAAALEGMPRLKIVITLGKIAHDSTVRALGGKPAHHPFAHGAETGIGNIRVVSSYHCSRYNTNTGRLTVDMFDAIFDSAVKHLTAT